MGTISTSRDHRHHVGLLLLPLALSMPLCSRPALSAAPQGDLVASSPELVCSLLPNVVNVTARSAAASSTDAGQDQAGSAATQTVVGSGFVVDPAGLIVTNWHVVDGAYEITVTFHDGSHAPAAVANAMRLRDVAILKVEPSGSPPAAIR